MCKDKSVAPTYSTHSLVCLTTEHICHTNASRTGCQREITRGVTWNCLREKSLRILEILSAGTSTVNDQLFGGAEESLSYSHSFILQREDSIKSSKKKPALSVQCLCSTFQTWERQIGPVSCATFPFAFRFLPTIL